MLFTFYEKNLQTLVKIIISYHLNFFVKDFWDPNVKWEKIPCMRGLKLYMVPFGWASGTLDADPPVLSHTHAYNSTTTVCPKSLVHFNFLSFSMKMLTTFFDMQYGILCQAGCLLYCCTLLDYKQKFSEVERICWKYKAFKIKQSSSCTLYVLCMICWHILPWLPQSFRHPLKVFKAIVCNLCKDQESWNKCQNLYSRR